jgi:hypothetical protein
MTVRLLRTPLSAAAATAITLFVLLLIVLLGPAADAVSIVVRCAEGGTSTRVYLDSVGPASLIGSTVLAADGRCPPIRWDTWGVPRGAHVLIAQRSAEGSVDLVPVIVGFPTGEPHASIYEPTFRIRGTVPMSGWAFDRNARDGPAIARVDVYLDRLAPDTFVGSASYGEERPDVVAEYGEVFRYSGWRVSLESGRVAPGSHTLIAIARSSLTGEATTVTRTITIESSDVTIPSATVPAIRAAATAGQILAPANDAIVFGSQVVRLVGVVGIGLALALVGLSVSRGRRVLEGMTVGIVTTAVVGFAFVDRTTIKANALTDLFAWFPHATHQQSVDLAALLGSSGLIPAALIAPPLLPAAVAAGLLALGTHGPRRLVWLALTLAAACVVLASGSRTPIVALTAGVAFGIASRWVQARWLIAVVGIVVGGLLVAVIVQDPEYAFPGRVVLWINALEALAEHPFTGPGFGTFGQLPLGAHQAHNIGLQTLVDLGPIGFAAVVAACAVALRAAFALVRAPNASGNAIGSAQLCIGVVVATIIAGTTDSVLAFPVPLGSVLATLFWPVAFVAAQVPRLDTRPPRIQPR